MQDNKLVICTVKAYCTVKAKCHVDTHVIIANEVVSTRK